MNITNLRATDVTARIRPGTDDPDAPVRVGYTDDGDVVVALTRPAAGRLARVLFDLELDPAAADLPDRATWTHAGIDLLTACALASAAADHITPPTHVPLYDLGRDKVREVDL